MAFSSRFFRSPLRAMLLARRALPETCQSPLESLCAGQRDGGTAAFAAQVVGQLVGADREQVAFERAAAVVVRQAVQEAEERLLHDVFARAAAAEAAFDEGEQPAFVARDQIVPRIVFAAADALDRAGSRRPAKRSWRGDEGERTLSRPSAAGACQRLTAR